jgi:hypothetical protein
MEEYVYDQNEQDHEYGKPHDQYPKPADADREGGGRWFFRQAGREIAKGCSATGSTDENCRGTADY